MHSFSHEEVIKTSRRCTYTLMIPLANTLAFTLLLPLGALMLYGVANPLLENPVAFKVGALAGGLNGLLTACPQAYFIARIENKKTTPLSATAMTQEPDDEKPTNFDLSSLSLWASCASTRCCTTLALLYMATMPALMTASSAAWLQHTEIIDQAIFSLYTAAALVLALLVCVMQCTQGQYVERRNRNTLVEDDDKKATHPYQTLSKN